MSSPLTKFSLKTLLLVLTLVALTVLLGVTRVELAEKTAQLKEYRDEMRYLDVEDETKIHAINIPGFGRKSWRWRIYLPPDRKFRLRVAYDDVPASGIPSNAPDLMMCELPPGESILTATVSNESGQWRLVLYSETDGNQNFDFATDVNGAKTDWLAKRGGCSVNVAGISSTVNAATDEPFVLVSYRDGLSPRPGVTATNPNPTDGVILWILEVDAQK